MPNAAGTGHHRVEGVEERSADDPEVRRPDQQDQLDDGPTMTGIGAMPSGSEMDHWATAMPDADATKPDSMPRTASTRLPGENRNRTAV